VDVGRVFLHRLSEDGIDETNDGRIVFAFEQVGLLGQVLRKMRKVGGLLDALGGFHGVVASLVGLAQQRIERVVFDLLQADRDPEITARLGDGERRRIRTVDTLGDSPHGFAERGFRAAWRTRTRRVADDELRSLRRRSWLGRGAFRRRRRLGRLRWRHCGDASGVGTGVRIVPGRWQRR
jgi:hypothetical protein